MPSGTTSVPSCTKVHFLVLSHWTTVSSGTTYVPSGTNPSPSGTKVPSSGTTLVMSDTKAMMLFSLLHNCAIQHQTHTIRYGYVICRFDSLAYAFWSWLDPLVSRPHSLALYARYASKHLVYTTNSL